MHRGPPFFDLVIDLQTQQHQMKCIVVKKQNLIQIASFSLFKLSRDSYLTAESR